MCFTRLSCRFVITLPSCENRFAAQTKTRCGAGYSLNQKALQGLRNGLPAAGPHRRAKFSTYCQSGSRRRLAGEKLNKCRTDALSFRDGFARDGFARDGFAQAAI
jgi:hypothetical protein